MKYFTSDWHLGEDRIGINEKPNLFYRPFTSVEEQNETIIRNFLDSGFSDGDELWHLGDVVYKWNTDSKNPFENSENCLKLLRRTYPKSTFNLIIGNYDEDKLNALGNYFDNIHESYYVQLNSTIKGIYLNHYPIKCVEEQNRKDPTPWDFTITGHIHGLWKVQRGMINVGVDAWHFRPVPESTIEFAMNACERFYDLNVFPY